MLLDRSMPGAGGASIVRRLKELLPARGWRSSRARISLDDERGLVDAVLTKPFSYDELARRVNELVKRR